MASNRTIVLVGNSGGSHHEEGILDTIASPGMHVQMAADGHWDPSPAAVGELVKSGVWIVKEDRLQGKGVADAYAVGDVAFLYMPLKGDRLNLLVKSGENIAVGDIIETEGGGTGLFVEAAGTEASYKAKAVESTGGALAANGLVACVWLGL